MTSSPPPTDTARLAEALGTRREHLAEALSQASPQTWGRKSETAKDIHRACADRLLGDLAAALAPVVERIAARRAAEELELAAVLTVPSQDTSEEVRESLFRRADALHARAAALAAAAPTEKEQDR